MTGYKEKLDINTDPKNFVEAYLQEKYKKEQQGCGENYSKIQLLNVCRNLFEGGQETTSDTILWCIIHLMLNPKIQQKVQEELENVVGKNKLITVQEKPMLPFMQAVINESQRIANLLPINVRHTTTRDVIIKGYNIKEGTLIVPHIGMVLYNEENQKISIPNDFWILRASLKPMMNLFHFLLANDNVPEKVWQE
uniref:Cytochrome P450 n=1 Tax=Acrobeloides nanus TaxID=290746 RepID=A0A914BVR7_9BILA